VVVLRTFKICSGLEFFVEEGFHIFETATTGFGVEEPYATGLVGAVGYEVVE
jgi:hypothetical protein